MQIECQTFGSGIGLFYQVWSGSKLFLPGEIFAKKELRLWFITNQQKQLLCLWQTDLNVFSSCIKVVFQVGRLCIQYLIYHVCCLPLIWSLCLFECCREILSGFARAWKYLNLEGFIDKSLKIKSALKSTGKSLKTLKSPWILLFSVGLSTVDRDPNQYKFFVPLFGAAYAAPKKAHQFYFNFPVHLDHYFTLTLISWKWLERLLEVLEKSLNLVLACMHPVY